MCIVGNKTDLEKNRNVTKEEAEQYVELLAMGKPVIHFVQVCCLS